MFADFLQNLLAPEPQQLPDTDARLALTALLVRIAKSDGDYATAEQDQIDAVMSKRYALTPADMTDLRRDAETLEAEAPDTVRFTRAIKEAVPYVDRLGVIEALWSVVLADGKRTNEESALMRMVANFLGIEDMDSHMARKRVEEAG